MSILAINGGTPIRTKLFPSYNTIGQEEKDAVMKVLDSGNLSQYIGGWHHDFFGGSTVKRLENNWSQLLGIKHSVTVNSNTSGLFTAMGAIGIQPGDEVIVSPYSMSASAIAPLVYGGIPVFADIDEETLCMSAQSIEACITDKTKAILIVHIMGHPADMDAIMALARTHNLYVVEDCAQAPMGKYKNKYVGTIGDLGIFSLNYHKHIHTGEGGIIVTDSDDLAFRCQMIRNHAENIVGPKEVEDLTNLIGFNYRMTEIECAIGVEQIKKLPALLEERLENVAFFNEALKQFPGLKTQAPQPKGNVHCYYQYPVFYDQEIIGIHRNKFVEALKAEIPSAILRETAPLIGSGYVKPLYLAPLYQKKAAWAFGHQENKNSGNYQVGLCPVTERMHNDEIISLEYMRPGLSKQDMQDVVNAIDKVISHVDELKK